MKLIYADTSVWNRLCDEHVDPATFAADLAARNSKLALGFNVFYEIGKIFNTGDVCKVARGRELLRYLATYLSLRTPIMKENGSLLIEEAEDAMDQQKMESYFFNDSQYRIAVSEIEKLNTAGSFDPPTAKFFAGRKDLAETSRLLIREHLRANPEAARMCERVTERHLLKFLNDKSTGIIGKRLLVKHLAKEFPKSDLTTLRQAAKQLLRRPTYRLSTAICRGDFYLSWRCVHRKSLRDDLPDDSFHVINAAYCDVFMTTETDQANIAKLVLVRIKPLVCARTQPILPQIFDGLARSYPD
jgi:hypothetical protein